VAISATTGEGIPALLAELGSQLRPIREFLELSVPHDRYSVIARLHEVGQVVERNTTARPHASRPASLPICTASSPLSSSASCKPLNALPQQLMATALFLPATALLLAL